MSSAETATSTSSRETASAPLEMRRERKVYAFDLPDEYANKLDNLSRESASNMKKARTGAFAMLVSGIVAQDRKASERFIEKTTRKTPSLEELTKAKEKTRSYNDRLSKLNRLFGHSLSAAEDINREVYEVMHEAIEKAQAEWIHEQYMAADETDREYDLLSPEEIEAHEQLVAESFLEQYNDMLHSSIHGDNETSEGIGKNWMEITGEFFYGKNKDRMTDAERIEYEKQEEKINGDWKRKYGRAALRGLVTVAGVATVGTAAVAAGAALAPAAMIAGGVTWGAKYFFKAQRDRGGIKWQAYESPEALRTAVGDKQAAIGKGAITEEARREEFGAAQLNSREEFKKLEKEQVNRELLEDSVEQLEKEVNWYEKYLAQVSRKIDEKSEQRERLMADRDILSNEIADLKSNPDHDAGELRAKEIEEANLKITIDDLFTEIDKYQEVERERRDDLKALKGDLLRATRRLDHFEEHMATLKGGGNSLERIGAASRTLIAGLSLEKEAQKAEIKEGIQNKRTVARVLGGAALGAAVSGVMTYVAIPGVGRAAEWASNNMNIPEMFNFHDPPAKVEIPHLDASTVESLGEGYNLERIEGSDAIINTPDGEATVNLFGADGGGDTSVSGDKEITPAELTAQLDRFGNYTGTPVGELPDTFDMHGNVADTANVGGEGAGSDEGVREALYGGETQNAPVAEVISADISRLEGATSSSELLNPDGVTEADGGTYGEVLSSANVSRDMQLLVNDILNPNGLGSDAIVTNLLQPEAVNIQENLFSIGGTDVFEGDRLVAGDLRVKPGVSISEDMLAQFREVLNQYSGKINQFGLAA